MCKVSIVMPVYNQELYIGQAIQSVLDQTYPDFELIIIDDGSTDGTPDRIRTFTDTRIRYIFQDNQERSAARNLGLSMAKGTYVAFLDADDFWLPTYLERQVAELDARPECGLSHTWVYDTDITGRPLRVGGDGASDAASHEEFTRALLIENLMSSIAVVIRKECLESTGCFDTKLRQSEDWELWIRIALQYEVATIQQPLACYRHYNAFMPEREYNRGIEKAHVYIINKTFARLQDSTLYALRDEALGHAYWRAAWTNYALGRIEEGQRYLTKAYQVYPEFFEPPYKDFIDRVVYRADALFDVCTPLAEGLKSIERLLSNLPAWASHLKILEREAKGYYCGVNLFRSYGQADWPAVRRAASLAIMWRPRWALNRGFVSIAAQAFLPLHRRFRGL